MIHFEPSNVVFNTPYGKEVNMLKNALGSVEMKITTAMAILEVVFRDCFEKELSREDGQKNRIRLILETATDYLYEAQQEAEAAQKGKEQA